jgi:hypothetical protein
MSFEQAQFVRPERTLLGTGVRARFRRGPRRHVRVGARVDRQAGRPGHGCPTWRTPVRGSGRTDVDTAGLCLRVRPTGTRHGPPTLGDRAARTSTRPTHAWGVGGTDVDTTYSRLGGRPHGCRHDLLTLGGSAARMSTWATHAWGDGRTDVDTTCSRLGGRPHGCRHYPLTLGNRQRGRRNTAYQSG